MWGEVVVFCLVCCFWGVLCVFLVCCLFGFRELRATGNLDTKIRACLCQSCIHHICRQLRFLDICNSFKSVLSVCMTYW